MRAEKVGECVAVRHQANGDQIGGASLECTSRVVCRFFVSVKELELRPARGGQGRVVQQRMSLGAEDKTRKLQRSTKLVVGQKPNTKFQFNFQERFMKSKYIIIEMNETEMPLIFSPFLSHEDVVVAGRNNVKSAGYCELDVAGKWVVSGESVSLKLYVRPQDAGILNTHLSDTFAYRSAKRTATT